MTNSVKKVNVFEKSITSDRFGFTRILIDLNFCLNYSNAHDSGRLFESRTIKKTTPPKKNPLCVDKLISLGKSFQRNGVSAPLSNFKLKLSITLII